MAVEQTNWLSVALEGIGAARVAVFGDFCLDAYWLIDPDKEDLSVETGLPVRCVHTQRYCLGGAGNVVANLAALRVGQIRAVGLVGDDAFGGLMLKILGELGVDTKGLLNFQADWQTVVYGKTCIGNEEQNRVDFGAFNAISTASIECLAHELARVADEGDVVILNQQVPAGVSTPGMIKEINDVIARSPQSRFIVDSRHRSEQYRGAMLKMNEHEAVSLVREPRPADVRVTAAEARRYAADLYRRVSQPVFLTRGENGIVVADESGLVEIPGIQTIERVDSVGAGDTIVAALAAVVGSGGDVVSAASLANVAASITVRKLQTTGTATPEEILQVGPRPDYVYLPELADDLRNARYVDGTEIEIVHDLPEGLHVRHAIFDHDGTLSTLRQGWENIMAPMMMKAILGSQMKTITDEAYRRVEEDVKTFIDRTTGIQTLAQMKGLIALVREYGFVPASEILDEHGYKAVYNEALLEMIRLRIFKIKRNELNAQDFEIKGARALLETLHAAGVKLYLASGTDEPDVQAEAEVMGYAHLFHGGIYGAVGDINFEAKRMVLERIFNSVGAAGSEVMVVGDGPVELREGKKRGTLCLGVASNEIRRYGLDETKRARIIRAGADYVVPDFSQLRHLKPLLGLL